MSALLNLQPLRPRSQHVTSEEYSAFTRQRPTIRSGNNLLKAYRRFIYHYPDLDQWFQAPLAERIGQTKPRSGKAYVSAIARPYLYYLARTGQLSFEAVVFRLAVDHWSALPCPAGRTAPSRSHAVHSKASR